MLDVDGRILRLLNVIVFGQVVMSICRSKLTEALIRALDCRPDFVAEIITKRGKKYFVSL